MSTWINAANLIVGATGGGVFGGMGSALVTAVRHRRLDDATANVQRATEAQIASGLFRDVSADLRADNVQLRAKVGTLETKIDGLDSKVDALEATLGRLADVLWRAVRRLEELGDDTAEYRKVLNSNSL